MSEALVAFAEWAKSQGPQWKLGALREGGTFLHFCDPETDSAWMGFEAAWNTRADLHRAEVEAAVKRALDAAAETCDVATMDVIGDLIRGKGDEIRALASDSEALRRIVEGKE
jgi:hypothetical protein